MGKITGATLMARALKQQGVDFMYGVVGFPVVPLAYAAEEAGITYVGMRNEQSASYAAQAAGYLTGRPQACLVVSGPGVIHGLAGLANAQENCWPMILIGGASPTENNGRGAFQEERQTLLASPLTKYAHGVERIERIPFYVEQAIRKSLYGRPGAVYLDMPDEVIIGEIDEDEVEHSPTVADPPRSLAQPDSVEAALDALESAERPLVIIGKGMAWSRAEDEVRQFIERTQVPFLSTPMGKGVMPDDHPLSVGGARSLALQEADVILLMGARLNWILHFGLPPRFAKDVRVVQLDLNAEEISNNRQTEVALVGDGSDRAIERGAFVTSVVLPQRHPVARSHRRKDRRQSGRGGSDGRGSKHAHELFPCLCRYRAAHPKGRDHCWRGRQHHGHRSNSDAQFQCP